MEVATGLIREALEELPGQSKAKDAGHILHFIRMRNFFKRKIVQTPPNQVRPAAEINHAPGEAFVHGNIGFASKGILGIEAGAVAANAFLITQGLQKSLS